MVGVGEWVLPQAINCIEDCSGDERSSLPRINLSKALLILSSAFAIAMLNRMHTSLAKQSRTILPRWTERLPQVLWWWLPSNLASLKVVYHIRCLNRYLKTYILLVSVIHNTPMCEFDIRAVHHSQNRDPTSLAETQYLIHSSKTLGTGEIHL